MLFRRSFWSSPSSFRAGYQLPPPCCDNQSLRFTFYPGPTSRLHPTPQAVIHVRGHTLPRRKSSFQNRRQSLSLQPDHRLFHGFLTGSPCPLPHTVSLSSDTRELNPSRPSLPTKAHYAAVRSEFLYSSNSPASASLFSSAGEESPGLA